jgi:hypothetical protein
MGCTLLVLDLALLPDSSERSHYAWETDIPAEVGVKALVGYSNVLNVSRISVSGSGVT